MRYLSIIIASILLFPLTAVGQGVTIPPPQPYNILRPSGGNDAPQLAAAFASSATQPVFLSSGTYLSCVSLTVPRNGNIQGPNGEYVAFDSPLPPAIIKCNAGGSFGQMILLKDHSRIDGFAVNANAAGSVDCVNAQNLHEPVITNMVLSGCSTGINRFSNGSVAGDGFSSSIGAVIQHNTIWGFSAAGYSSGCSNGGFVSDDRIIDNDIFAFGAHPNILASCLGNTQINDNRSEDTATTGGYALDCEGSNELVVTGNVFDRTQGLLFNGCIDITLTGNQFHGYPSGEGGPSAQAMTFSGVNTRLRIGPNGMNGDMTNDYLVNAGGYFNNSIFFESASDSRASGSKYANALTLSSILPITTNLGNYVSGGVGLAGAQWPTTGITLTQNAGSDPYGGSTAASIVETAVTSQHNIIQTGAVPLPNTTLQTTVYAANLSGTRQLTIVVASDNSFANYAAITFSLVDGSIVSASNVGSASLIKYAVTATGVSGFYAATLQYKLGTVATAPQYDIALFSAGSNSYLGVAGTGAYVWNPVTNIVASAAPIRSTPTQQRLTSGTTYTTAIGARELVVTACGGGGGGGGAGATTGPTGTNGNNTTFNSIVASGGLGGVGTTGTTGGAGGALPSAGTGTATYRTLGTAGDRGNNGVTVAESKGGRGGVNFSGTASSLGGDGATTAAATPGGGGGGSAGECFVLRINAPAASYTVAIGGTAAGGVGTGTAAATGGAGSAGVIIVDEYY